MPMQETISHRAEPFMIAIPMKSLVSRESASKIQPHQLIDQPLPSVPKARTPPERPAGARSQTWQPYPKAWISSGVLHARVV